MMRKFFFSFLISCFIFTIISCGKTTEENVNDAVSKTNDTVFGTGGDSGDQCTSVRTFQRNIYGERIRSLTDKGVDIHIGSNFGSKSGMTRDRIEMGVRLYRDVCRHGMIDLKDIKNVPSYVSSAIERLTSYNISKMSAPGLLAGIKIGYQTALTCSKIGAWIVCDED